MCNMNNKNIAERSFSGLPAERPSAATGRIDGFYHCHHCGDGVTPSAALIEVAEDAPEPDPALKCPHCHRHAVHWRMPSPVRTRQRPEPVSLAHGRELFAGIGRMLAET